MKTTDITFAWRALTVERDPDTGKVTSIEVGTVGLDTINSTIKVLEQFRDGEFDKDVK